MYVVLPHMLHLYDVALHATCRISKCGKLQQTWPDFHFSLGHHSRRFDPVLYKHLSVNQVEYLICLTSTSTLMLHDCCIYSSTVGLRVVHTRSPVITHSQRIHISRKHKLQSTRTLSVCVIPVLFGNSSISCVGSFRSSVSLLRSKAEPPKFLSEYYLEAPHLLSRPRTTWTTATTTTTTRLRLAGSSLRTRKQRSEKAEIHPLLAKSATQPKLWQRLEIVRCRRNAMHNPKLPLPVDAPLLQQFLVQYLMSWNHP